MTSDNEERGVPEGQQFLQLIWKLEDATERHTDEKIATLGEKAPACLEKLGTVMSLVDRLSSCWWGCQKCDHVVEYLCGRASSTSRASLRLLRLGFYDESLALIRTIGEIANLFYLFLSDRSSYETWLKMSDKARKQSFGPVHVRIKIEELGQTPPIDAQRYSLLSDRSAHVHPRTRPQAHNFLGLPSCGVVYQEAGHLVCLNEVALALGYVAVFGAVLTKIDKTHRHEVLDAARALVEQIGGANILEIDSYFASVRQNLQPRTEAISEPKLERPEAK